MIERLDDDLRAILDAERATDLGDLSDARERVRRAVLERVGPGPDGGGEGGAPNGAGAASPSSTAVGKTLAWIGAAGAIAALSFFAGHRLGQDSPRIIEVERVVEVERFVEVPAQADVEADVQADEADVEADRETVGSPVAERPQTTPVPTALDEERRLLDRARAALRGGRAHDALVALMEHERRFVQGSFAEERDRLVVEGLVAAGRRNAARTRITRFLREHPNSVHRDDVRAMGEGL